MTAIIIYIVASVIAGLINTLAGGGSFVTFPALLYTGLDPRAANITSTIALFPMQVSTGYAGRHKASGTERVSLRLLTIISTIGGAIGAGLLLLTPPATFGVMVPWLILIATLLFAWGSFFRRPTTGKEKPKFGQTESIIAQTLIAIYGGYFGGGIGILMLAALTLAGQSIHNAASTKNILAGIMNASAVVIFLFSPDIAWTQAIVGMMASVFGGYIGHKMLNKVNEKFLRIAVVAWGLALTIGMFLRG
ncbi:MAG: sulfite exporter TauE/SafE family protein [Alphaproteobacteria bacterium]|nr:sulfite exporter TauE/SafE family protein [Alphaproteobacteria bacterium]MBV8548547.1 sulfite exporter TauE/SafE family protein [Alphaproteobacteria bacterium]